MDGSNGNQTAKTYGTVMPTPSLNINELSEKKCVYLDDGHKHLLFLCELKNEKRPAVCPECDTAGGIVKHGTTADRIVHDFNIGGLRVDIMLRPPRYKCRLCDKTFVYKYDDIMENQQFTKRLYTHLRELVLSHPFLEVSKEYGISDTTAANILRDYAKELEHDRVIKAPRVLGIDEKHIVHKMRGVFTDIENGTLLEMTENNRKDTVIRVIESMDSYDTNIKYVTMDMSMPYVKAVEECLPNAKIIIDKYHVIQQLYKNIKQCKKEITQKLKTNIEKMPESDDKVRKSKLLTRMGKNPYLFKFGQEKLKELPRSASLMCELCNEFDEIRLLYKFKLEAERIYSAQNAKEADAYINDLIRDTPTEEAFRECAMFCNMLSRWRAYILNYFITEDKYTNAATEGLNSLIGAINSLGRGYSFDILRIKSLYHESATKKPKRQAVKKNLPSFNAS